MEFNVKSGQPHKQRTACIVVGVFAGRKLSSVGEVLDKASEGYISNLLRRGDLEGNIGQLLLLHYVPNILSDRVLLVGCGKERDLGHQQFKKIIKNTVSSLNDTGSMEAVCFLTELNIRGRDTHWKIRHAVEAANESLYSFNELKTKKDATRRPLRKLIFTVPTRRELNQGELATAEGQAISDGIKITKDLANLPPNICTPDYLAKYCQKLARTHEKIKTTVLDEEEMQSLGMGALLAVARASSQAAKLITMEYSGQDNGAHPVVLIGKGITFDTGGNSIKPKIGMMGMKFDMCGAASIIGVMDAVAKLELPINVVGVIASAENMLGPDAYRPDDIITSLSGMTIEVLNTDAEGRLVLCDALTYSERFNPDVVIDVATLTGAILVSLGEHATGLFSNHNPLAHELLNAGKQSGDRAWQLPIWDEYHKNIESNVADICQIGTNGTSAGSITAACFLSNFAKKFHWAHLDVAGTAAVITGKNRGATGRPVGLLMQFLINRTNNLASK